MIHFIIIKYQKAYFSDSKTLSLEMQRTVANPPSSMSGLGLLFTDMSKFTKCANGKSIFPCM